MATPHDLFLQMIMGQQAPVQPPAGAIDETGATGAPKPEGEAPKKKPGLTPDQWKLISAMLENPADRNPPATPSAPIVKGDGGSGQLINNPLAQAPARPQNPLWLALMGERGR